MALTISNISAVLKKVIIPTIQAQLPKESILFDKVKRNSGVTIANNQIYISARTGRHSGIYSVAEGNQPYTGKAKYEQPYDAMKYVFGTLELTDQAIEAAQSGDVKAIASILQTEISALKDDIVMDANRQMQGAGKGILCYTNGTNVAGTTLTVATSPAGGDPTEYLVEGMYIHVGTNVATVISSIDSSTTVTLASVITWDHGDYVCKGTGTTITSATGTDVEINGIAGLIDDGDNLGTVHNILRSSYPWANSWTEDTAATLTEAYMIDLYLKTKRYGGTKVIMTGSELFSKYGQLMTAYKKSANMTEVLSGGWKGLEFMDGAGVVLDFDCWSGYMQFVDFDALTIAEMSQPWQWLEADAHGGILKRSSDNRTIWEGTLKYYYNLICKKFKSQGRLSGKTTS